MFYCFLFIVFNILLFVNNYSANYAKIKILEVNKMLNLKEIREEKNLQQKEIAERLNRTPACISSWETGKTEPSIDDLVKLADLLDVSLDYLLNRTDENNVVQEIRDYSPLHKKMLSLFDKLSHEDRMQTLGFMQALLH